MYQPLSTSTHEIRLVHILPASYGEPISISLSHEDLDLTAQPVYEALSYEWGPEIVSMETIKVVSHDQGSIHQNQKEPLLGATESSTQISREGHLD